ncbi:MAG TPA: DUF177 domain-containing protein [Thermoanaerobaculia bacterium]|jgi:uncharacterized protein|nr:DUF177 domain-containing protein [Thermoanaerobaculia bacterium]
MDLNLELAFDEPVDLSHTFEISKEKLGREELLSLQPVRFSGRLMKTDPGFALTGRIEIAGTAECVRCLGEVPFSRSGPVSWVFAPTHERPKAEEEETELADTDLDVVWYDDFVVPFDPLIEEQLQLEIPMKPLCRESCLGLCPKCGADRNSAPCGCSEEADDRWTALRSLLGPRG